MPEHVDFVPAPPPPSPGAPVTPVGVPAPLVGEVPPVDPGKTLGIVGFALSFVAVANLVALVLSIVGLVRSRRVGRSNGFAVAGIVISAVGLAITTIVVTMLASSLVNAAQMCAELGDGVHHVGASTYTCTPTSFSVYTGTAD